MSQVTFIINSKRNITISTECGNCTDSDLIYAAQCTKYDLIYVGCSVEKLNKRFNGHRYDVRHNNMTSMEFAEYFNTNNCNFDKHIKVHIPKKYSKSNPTQSTLKIHEDGYVSKLVKLPTPGK